MRKECFWRKIVRPPSLSETSLNRGPDHSLFTLQSHFRSGFCRQRRPQCSLCLIQFGKIFKWNIFEIGWLWAHFLEACSSFCQTSSCCQSLHLFWHENCWLQKQNTLLAYLQILFLEMQNFAFQNTNMQILFLKIQICI